LDNQLDEMLKSGSAKSEERDRHSAGTDDFLNRNGWAKNACCNHNAIS
jgi:hypothetical protein